jgi:RNA polymerase sigma factor (sigma-70 family)
MIKAGNPALDPLDSIEFKNIDWENWYNEYLESYKKIHKLVNKIREEYKNTKDKDKIKERKIVYDAEKEIIENIMMIEEYLPFEKRLFLHKKNNEITKLIFNKSANFGFVPVEKLKYKEIEGLVHNKVLQNELLNMLKELLTDKQYTCVYLHYFEKMTQQKIADKLYISKQTINEHIFDSIKKIRNDNYFSNLLKYLK